MPGLRSWERGTMSFPWTQGTSEPSGRMSLPQAHTQGENLSPKTSPVWESHLYWSSAELRGSIL